LAIVALGIAAWLLRDPTPVFDERRGELVESTEHPPRRDSITAEHDVELRSSSGLRVHLAVRQPRDADSDDSTTKRAMFVILGGHARGRAAGALIPDTRGAIFASLEYPYEGNHAPRGVRESLRQVPAIRRALYDTPPAVELALDHLLRRADVDSARVELVGASFGATFATIAAARDPRVSRLWLVHGGGSPYTMIARGLEDEIPIAALRASAAGLATLLASGPRFAAEKWIGRVAPRPVIMLNAEDDERIPRESVDILWAATKEPRELVWLPGRHMGGNRPDVLARLVDEVMLRAAVSAPAPR
jgi:dienelactone hydrolase